MIWADLPTIDAACGVSLPSESNISLTGIAKRS
jgi:hypothetical protein